MSEIKKTNYLPNKLLNDDTINLYNERLKLCTQRKAVKNQRCLIKAKFVRVVPRHIEIVCCHLYLFVAAALDCFQLSSISMLSLPLPCAVPLNSYKTLKNSD